MVWFRRVVGRFIWAVPALMFVLSAAPEARAASIGYGAFVHGEINNADCRSYSSSLGNPDCMFSGTDPRFWWPGGVAYVPLTAATGALADADESISAFASLATGDLSVNLVSTGNSLSSSSSAFIWDTLTFHFNDNDVHQVTVNMAGNASVIGGTVAGYRLDLGPVGDPVFQWAALTLNGYVALSTGPYSAVASASVQDGSTVSVIAMLWVYGGGGSVMHIDDPLTFNLAGGTVTSASGLLLTENGATPVPEPSTLLLVAAGGALLQRRRRGM